MRKLIDLDGATFKALSIKAIEAGTNLKTYIENLCISDAGGGFKAKKHSTERTKKR